MKTREKLICDKCSGRLIRRKDDTPQIIKERLQIYNRQTRPLKKYYEAKIPIVNLECNNTETSPEDVARQILVELKKLGLICAKTLEMPSKMEIIADAPVKICE